MLQLTTQKTKKKRKKRNKKKKMMKKTKLTCPSLWIRVLEDMDRRLKVSQTIGFIRILNISWPNIVTKELRNTPGVSTIAHTILT